MKRAIWLTIWGLVVCVLTTAWRAQVRSGFDLSGVDAFWHTYDALRRNVEPARADWDAMFATPGYAALEQRERRRVALENATRFAFMPSRAAQRDSVIAAGGFLGNAVRHLMGIPSARDSIERFRRSLVQSDVIESARRAVAAFVPPGLTDSVAPPPVAVLFFLDNGRGYPNVVVVDLLALTRHGLDTGYFAHEFYHFYKRQFGKPLRAVAAADAGILELLGYPAEEGVADQLDKRAWVDLADEQFAAMQRLPNARPYAADYRDAYRHSDSVLRTVSSALERSIAAPDSANAIARAAHTALPDGGRALGAFMARAIDRDLGRPALIQAASDPIDFWLTYDKAASMSGQPRLSRTAEAVIQRLQLAYVDVTR